MDLTTETKRILEKNWNFKFKYTAPALPKYPHQWLWDSCFAAIINSKIDPQKAKEEIKTLLKSQDKNGFIPENINWFLSQKSKLTQLPMLAIAVEEIYLQTKDENFLFEVLPKVEKYYLWLRENRSSKNGLLYIVHPWESTDASPSFKLGNNPVSFYLNCYLILWGIRKFKFIDPFFNSIYTANLQSLFHLTKNKNYEKSVKLLINHLVEKVVNINPATLADFSLLIIDGLPGNIAKKLVEKLTDKNLFWTEFPLPFVSISNKNFNPNYGNFLLWHGPCWVNINWLFIRGLRANGFEKEANQLIKKTKMMVEKSGLWEMYHPFTGEGLGQKDYSWSGLVAS